MEHFIIYTKEHYCIHVYADEFKRMEMFFELDCDFHDCLVFFVRDDITCVFEIIDIFRLEKESDPICVEF